MKKSLTIPLILLGMFIIAQIIGLVVTSSYSPIKVVEGQRVNVTAPEVPFFENQEPETNYDFTEILFSIIFSFAFIVLIMFILIKYNSEKFFRTWYFIVVVIALSVVFNLAFIQLKYPLYFAIGLSLILAYTKVYQRNIIVHDFTELLVYPGVATAFVPLLNVYTAILLLLVISVYDLWAVWKSGIMQKMAKYQIKKMRVFAGILIPVISAKQREQMQKFSDNKNSKGKKVKISFAALGGGDIVFPIIAAGVFYRYVGIASSWFIILGATLGLSYIVFFGDKKKPYPAMPYITVGILLGILCWWILF